MSINVVAVNQGERLAITDTDIIGQIVAWLDGEGGDTDDASTAVIAIVHWPDGSWSPVDLRDYDGSQH